MNYQEIKRYVKQDEATSFYTSLKRKAGVILTWLILKTYPSISANFITLTMLPLNVLSAGMMYYAIVTSQPIFLLIAFIISFLTLALDSVDGNIARINNTRSIRGVYFDRLVHNISHPMFFIVMGFALYSNTNHIGYLIVMLVVGILSELSPLDVSQKDVEALFIRQILFERTVNYDFMKHQESHLHLNKQQKAPSMLRKIIKTILMNDVYYLVILLDLVFFEHQFYFTIMFSCIDLVAMIYVRANISMWEIRLNEVLKELYRQQSRKR